MEKPLEHRSVEKSAWQKTEFTTYLLNSNTHLRQTSRFSSLLHELFLPSAKKANPIPEFFEHTLTYHNWLVVWNIFSIYWEESSQLTFIFFRGVKPATSIVDYMQFTNRFDTSHQVGMLGVLSDGIGWKIR